MVYCFDIDGTLCTNTEGEYEKAEPYVDVIAQVNALHDAGHEILLYTARGATTGIDWRELTEGQLKSWGVKFNKLFMGKPTADIYVDDKAVNLENWKTSLGSPRDRLLRAPAIEKSVLKSPSYLDVTYSSSRAPYGDYPSLLAEWLFRKVYRRAGRLLDLGVGRGEHLCAFSRLGFVVAGVDISPRAPGLAAGHNVEVVDLESEPLPFPAESFDFVFSKSVVEHMRQPSCLLQKAFEALCPGGSVVIMTPSWEHTYWGPFYIDHTHVTPFTARSLADALSIVGFEAVKVSYFYQLPFLWRFPFLLPLAKAIALMPIPYRPYQRAPWPDGLNKLIRFSKEVMILGLGRRPER